MATTSNVLTREKNTFQQQSKQPIVTSNPSTTKTAKRKKKRKYPGVQASSMSPRSKDVSKEAKRPAVIVLEDDKRGKPIIGNFTLYRNSKKDTNSVTVLNNSAQRSKKSLEFRSTTQRHAESEIYSSTVYIDGVEIATELGSTAKKAKQCCAKKAFKRLKESHPIVDTFIEKQNSKKTKKDGKKTKKNGKKTEKRTKKNCQASQKKLPVDQNKEYYTKLTITKDSGGRCISTQRSSETLMATTVPQKRHSPDVAVDSKEKAKKTRLFIKENTPVEEVSCPSGQHSQLGPPTTNLYPEIPKENLGHQLLKRMGWMGGGLGRQGNEGRVEPVMHAVVRRRQGLGVDLRKQPGRKISNQVRNTEPCKPFSAIIGNQTDKSVSNIIQPSSATATMKPVCNSNLSAAATIQPFAATTSRSVSDIQPSFPTPSNINHPSAATGTTNKSVCNNIQPSSATATMKPINLFATATIRPFAATTSKSVCNNIQPSFPTPRLLASNINQPSATTTNKSVSNNIQPSAATATMKPINLFATATIQPFAATTSKSVSNIQPSFPTPRLSASDLNQPFAATTSKSVSNIQPSFPTPRLSASNINQPFAATTNKLVCNNIQPSSATVTMKPINLFTTATIQPFAATTSKSVSNIQPSFLTPRLSASNINQPSAATTNKSVSKIIQPPSATAMMKPLCNINLSATSTIQPCAATTNKSVSNTILPSFATPRLSASNINQPSARKTSQSVIDVDTCMLFESTSTNSARNGVTSHPPLMSIQLVSKPKTTVSPVPSKPVASTVKASLPIPSTSVRDMLYFQPTSSRSGRNSNTSEALKSVIDKEHSCVTSNPIDVIDVDMVTAQTNAIRNINFETSVKHSLLKTVLGFLKSSKKELRLSDLLTRDSRISLFRMCDVRGLQFQSFIKAKKRTIIISKPED